MDSAVPQTAAGAAGILQCEPRVLWKNARSSAETEHCSFALETFSAAVSPLLRSLMDRFALSVVALCNTALTAEEQNLVEAVVLHAVAKRRCAGSRTCRGVRVLRPRGALWSTMGQSEQVGGSEGLVRTSLATSEIQDQSPNDSRLPIARLRSGCAASFRSLSVFQQMLRQRNRHRHMLWLPHGNARLLRPSITLQGVFEHVIAQRFDALRVP